MPAYWTKEEINNELVAFDMEINAGNNWPSITFCANSTKGDYLLVDCYMIGFRKDMIELQRWRNGQRIYIFGDEAGHPVGGPGVPNWIGGQTTFKYDRRHSIVAGALDTPEGTRIILTINGVNVIDYLDNSEQRLPAKGYFGAYNPSPGKTTFYPYTALTYENY